MDPEPEDLSAEAAPEPSPIPVVGLGGSAGGVSALRAFFAAMPENAPLAFVVILHLAPHRESSLAEVLSECTTLPVEQAREGDRVKAGRVHVIPPGQEMTLRGGLLRLVPLPAPTSKAPSATWSRS
jgi:two-component system CheB/CheR fusion protein